MSHTCPVCQNPSLKEPPRSKSGGGSYEICPSCGFQFGVDDDDRGISHEKWRADWLKRGAPWSSSGIKAPKGWKGQTQAAAAAPVKKKATRKAVKKTKTP